MLDIEIVKECIADYYYEEFGDETYDIFTTGRVPLLFTTDDNGNEIQVELDIDQESVIKYVNGKKVNTVMFASDSAYESFLGNMDYYTLKNL